MKKTTDQLNTEKIIKSEILSKFPLLGVTLNNSRLVPSSKVETIETDGTDIIYNPNYINDLPFGKQVFEFSHNLMHIQFNHVARSNGKDLTTWNYSTDAVINQILKQEGLSIDGVDISDAVNKSAEEVYTQLMNIQNRNSHGKSGNQQSLNNASSGQSENSQPLPSPNNNAGKNKQQSSSEGQSENNSSKQDEGKSKTNNQNNSSNNSQQQNETDSNNAQSQQGQQSQNQHCCSSNDGNNSNSNTQGNNGSSDNSRESSNNNTQNYPEDGNQSNSQDNTNSSSDSGQGQQCSSNEQQSSGQSGVGEISSEMLKNFEDYQKNGNAQQHSNWNTQAKKSNLFRKIMEMLNRKQDEQGQNYNEQHFSSSNRDLKNQRVEQLTDYLSKKKQGEGKSNDGKNGNSLQRLEQSETLEEYMSPIEEGFTPVIDWKKYLRRNKEIRREEKLEYTWTRRRANEDSYWQSRLERKKLLRMSEVEEKKPITLVAIDTSPSIPDELLKGFVNQLGELAKESRIFVGCFYDHFCGYNEIIPDKNGKMYIHLERGFGTDLDSACRSFKHFEQAHKDWKILNRIIFTDGDHANGSKPDYDLSSTDCLWLIFDYPIQFKCCCGRVLQFSSKSLMKDIKNENKYNETHQTEEKFTLT